MLTVKPMSVQALRIACKLLSYHEMRVAPGELTARAQAVAASDPLGIQAESEEDSTSASSDRTSSSIKSRMSRKVSTPCPMGSGISQSTTRPLKPAGKVH